MEEPDQIGVWKALASPVRRRLLDYLREKPRTTSQLAAGFQMSRIGVRQHLEVLQQAGLTTSQKRGRQRWHSLNNVPLQQIHRRWFHPFLAEQADRLISFRDALEAQVPESPYDLDIAQQIDIAAPRARVFQAVLNETRMWWGRPYINGDAVDLVLEPELGGRLIEVLADGGSILLGQVTVLRPDTRLELTGRLHLGVVTAVLDIRLSDIDTGTRLDFSFRAVGAISKDFVAPFTAGWTHLLGTLKLWIEDDVCRGIAAEARP